MRNLKPYKCEGCGAGVPAGHLRCRQCDRELSVEERFGFKCDLCRRGSHDAWCSQPGEQLCQWCFIGRMRIAVGG